MAKERRDNKNRLLWKGEYQKEDGRYMYKYTDSHGKAGYVYSWTLTKTDRTPKGKQPGKCLRDLEIEIAKNIDAGINISLSKNSTVNDYFDKYMDLRKKLKSTTRRNYRYQYDSYARDAIGCMKISKVKYSDIKGLYSRLICEEDMKVSTLQNLNSILLPIFSLAVRDKVISDNPADKVYVEIKRECGDDTNKKRALTIAQQKALVKFVEHHPKLSRWYPLVVFLLGTGCRIGEACGLTWDDCDFKNNIIRIERTLCYYPDENSGKCSFFFQTPKTKTGIREIPMLKDVRKVLLEEKKNQMECGFNTKTIDGVSGLVFMTKGKNAVAPRTFNYALDEIVKAYNQEEKLRSIGERRTPVYIQDISPHIFRHTFCTRLCEQQINIGVIQKIMGHSSISVTMNIYNDVTNELSISEFGKLDQALKIC